MTKNKVDQFYSRRGGEKLVDASKFIPEIKDYLAAEKALILRTILRGRYAGILEIGCMDARNLDIAVEAGVNYVGIDIVERFIAKAQRKVDRLDRPYVVAKCDVKDLSPVRNVISPRHLAIFPFNSFGNIDEPEKALGAVLEHKLDSLILTYKTDDATTKVRREYLLKNSMIGLKRMTTQKGVVFTSAQGLSSYAYNEKTIERMASDAGYSSCSSIPFTEVGNSDIGVAYHLVV